MPPLGAQRRWRWSLSAALNEVMEDRLSEVFAMLLTQVFVCGADVQSFRYHTMISYSQSTASVGVDDRGTILRFTDFLLRLFMATDMVDDLEGDPASWPSEHPGGSHWRFEAVQARFRAMVEELSPLLPENDVLLDAENRDAVMDFVMDQFRQIYNTTSPFLVDVWQQAIGIYHQFASTAIGEAGSGQRAPGPEASRSEDHVGKTMGAMKSAVVAAARTSMDSGRILVRSLCPLEYRSGEDSGLDPLVVVCGMLHAYFKEASVVKGKEAYLEREALSGDIRFDRKHAWHEALIDKGAASLFCPLPAVRRQRLRTQISPAEAIEAASQTTSRAQGAPSRARRPAVGCLPGHLAGPDRRVTAQRLLIAGLLGALSEDRPAGILRGLIPSPILTRLA